MQKVTRRTPGSLLFFRLVASSIMFFASLFLAANIYWAEEVRWAAQSRLPGGSGQTEFFHVLYPPMLLFACGAILFVLVEIAVRLGGASEDAFPRDSPED